MTKLSLTQLLVMRTFGDEAFGDETFGDETFGEEVCYRVSGKNIESLLGQFVNKNSLKNVVDVKLIYVTTFSISICIGFD
jgi:hypothetical protein